MYIYNHIYVYTFYNMAVLKKLTYFSKEKTLDCKGGQTGLIALFSPTV